MTDRGGAFGIGVASFVLQTRASGLVCAAIMMRGVVEAVPGTSTDALPSIEMDEEVEGELWVEVETVLKMVALPNNDQGKLLTEASGLVEICGACRKRAR